MHICARLRLAGRPPNPALETWPARRTHTTHTTQNTHNIHTQMHNTAQHRTHTTYTQHSTTHHSTERNGRLHTEHTTQTTHKTHTKQAHTEHTTNTPHTPREHTHNQVTQAHTHTHIYSPGMFGARRRGLPHEIGPTEFKKSASGGQMCFEHTQNDVAIRYSLAG